MINLKNVQGVFCSTGVMTNYPKFPSHKIILENGYKLNADGLELIIYPNWYDEIKSVTNELCASKLKFPTVHADKDIGPLITELNTLDYKKGMDILKLNCEVAEKLNAKLMVLHLWGLPLSDDKFENNIIAFEKCLKIAEEYGVTLAVESLPCRKYDPITNLKKLAIEYPQSKFVLDLRMLSYHDLLWTALETKWLWEKEYVIHMHINDYKGKPNSLEGLRCYPFPREGCIDFNRFFDMLKKLNYGGTLTLESSSLSKDGEVDYNKINNSLKYLKDNIER